MPFHFDDLEVHWLNPFELQSIARSWAYNEPHLPGVHVVPKEYREATTMPVNGRSHHVFYDGSFWDIDAAVEQLFDGDDMYSKTMFKLVYA